MKNNIVKLAVSLAVVATSFTGIISSAQAASHVYYDRKIIGLGVNNTYTGDVTVYTGTNICQSATDGNAYVRMASSKTYDAVIASLTAAYLSGSIVTLEVDDTSCAILGVRLGKKS